MDIVVATIPVRFFMLFSRSCGSKIGGSIKLDLMYSTIPTFRGEERRLYRDFRFITTITRVKGSNNDPMYGRESDLCFLLLEEDDYILEETQVHPSIHLHNQQKDIGKVRKLYFDGDNSREGNGAGVLLVSPERSLIPLSFKLEFKATNNVAKYEALLLWLQTARNMNIDCLTVYGDFELVVKKIRNQFQDKNPRLRSYKKKVWDLMENFLVFNV